MFAGVYASTGTYLVQLTAVQRSPEPLPADRSSRNPPPETVRKVGGRPVLGGDRLNRDKRYTQHFG